MKDKIKIDLETGLMVDIVHPSEHGDDIVETPCDIPYHLPKWNGTEWVEGGQAPEPAEPEPQASTMEQMAIALMQTQAELEEVQEALDFLIMGGMY